MLRLARAALEEITPSWSASGEFALPDGGAANPDRHLAVSPGRMCWDLTMSASTPNRLAAADRRRKNTQSHRKVLAGSIAAARREGKYPAARAVHVRMSMTKADEVKSVGRTS